MDYLEQRNQQWRENRENAMLQGGQQQQSNEWDTGKWGQHGINRDVSPYDPTSPYAGWDSTGTPQFLPRGDYVFDWQFEADRRAQERRDQLWADANQSLMSGMDLFQSYRPGGSAALAAGLFQSQANLLGTQAQTIQAPDLLIAHRAEEQRNADEDRRRSERLAMGLALGGAALGAAGGFAGSGALTALGGGLSAASGMAGGSAAQGGQGTVQQGGQIAQAPAGVAANAAQGIVSAPAGTMAAGGTYALRAGAGGAAAPPPSPGGGGVGGAAGPAGAPAGPGVGGAAVPGGAAGAQGGGVDSPPQGAAGAGGAIGSSGLPGDAPMATMTPTEAAVNAHSSTPMAAATIYQEWADSPERKSSLNNMMISARHRLLVAMGIAQTAQVMLGFSEHMSWQRAAERSRGVRLPR